MRKLHIQMPEWLRRAVRTFFQAAFGYLSVHLVTTISGADDLNTLYGTLCSLLSAALAAGAAALMNLRAKGANDGE